MMRQFIFKTNLFDFGYNKSINCVLMNLLVKLTLLLLVVTIVSGKSQYRVTNVDKTLSRVTLTLQYTGTDQYYLKPTSPITRDLKFIFNVHAFYDFYIKITDLHSSRYEVPQSDPWPMDPLSSFTYPINLSGMTFQYTTYPFDFKIIRKVTGATIFSTYDKEFIFSEHYMQIGTQVDTPYIYGLGERFSSGFRKVEGKWTIFNRDRGQVIDNGEGKQTYGYYPVYFSRQRNQHFHFNYLRNSNAMDVIVSQQNGKTYVEYRVIGGVFDFRFLLSETSPEVALQKWNLFIGASIIPPFWSFGKHQCRWGYENVSMLLDVIKNYQANDIPLDTIWSDIDYMVDYEDFTIDESRFPLDQMKQILSKYKYIPIIDAGIKVNDGVAYNQGRLRNVFIKTAKGDQYHGKVWPGTTTFVDFLHPNATQYWTNMLDILYQKVPFSGVWLDMNELANFCDGPCDGSTPQTGGFDYTKDLPYTPGQDSIESHTISLNATHYGSRKQADVHAFAGMLQTYATNKFLSMKNQKPFIITRSSTLGSHRYGFHWTGDNRAQWSYLKGSIADNFNFQLYGIQMVGPDICGFGGNTNEQLCARWYQLASLYPFARNHNDHDSISQQPYALGDVVLLAAKNNLKFRYSILKHYYTIFVTKKGLGSIFKPLFFAYPSDNNAYIDDIVDTQFMIGNDLLATPITQPNTTSRRIYLPQTKWYNFHTGQQYIPGTHSLTNISLTNLLPIFLKQGSAILTQDTQFVRQTKDLGNIYQLIGGMKYDQAKSTQETKYYRGGATILAVKDYNDDGLIARCVSQGCAYTLNLLLTVTQNVRTLEIDVFYTGGVGLNQLVVIDKVTLYYDGVVVTSTLSNPVQISGVTKVVIPINNNQLLQQE